MDSMYFLTENGRKICCFTQKQYNDYFELQKDLYSVINDIKNNILNLNGLITEEYLTKFITDITMKLETLNTVKIKIHNLSQEIPKIRDTTWTEYSKYQLGLILNSKFDIHKQCNFVISQITCINDRTKLFLDWIQILTKDFNLTDELINEIISRSKFSINLCLRSIQKMMRNEI